MSDWETASDGWETAGGWESPDKALLPSTDFKHEVPEVTNGSVVRQPDFKDERSFAGKTTDYLKGNLEATANVAGNLVAFPAGLVYGAATGDIEKGVQKASSLAYQPRTEEGEDILHKGQPVFDTMMALTGMPPLGHHVNAPLSKAKAVKPAPKDVAAMIKAEKEQVPGVPSPIANEAQMELPDAAMIQAPQYGVMKGMSRIDENGMPIKADVTMEARNLENPLQRNLWGDELPRQDAQENYRSLTKAMDKMEPEARTAAIEQTKLGREMSSPELDRAVQTVSDIHEPQQGPYVLRSPGGNQGGMMDLAGIHEGFSKLKEGVISVGDYLERFKGTFSELPKAINNLKNPASGDTIVLMSPSVFHDLAQRRTADEARTGPISRNNVRDALKMEDGLAGIPYLRTQLGKDGVLDVIDHDGRHRMDVFKENGVEVVPVRIKDSMIAWGIDSIPKTIRGQTGMEYNMPQPMTTRSPLSSGPGGRQRGAMLIPGSSKPPKESTPRAPTTPEDVALKQEREKKALALKLTGTPYESVHTLEDAMSNPGKDISNNVVRDAVSSGIAAQVYRNPTNRLLKYGRTIFTEARQNSEAFISKYVTGKDGVNRSYQKLDSKEWNDVANALQEGSKAKYKLTPELMTKLELNEKQQDVITKIYTALDEMYVMGNDALMSQGFNPFEYHEGYVPNMFSGAYTSLVYKGNKLISVAQADTRWGHNKAKEYFKGQEGIRFVDLPRRGLNAEVGRSRVYSGFNDIVSQIAKSDPEFAKMKMAVDQHVADSSKRLYQFDLHENTKRGVGGALGDKPWLDQQTNARQFLEGMIHYLEEGSRYYSYQDAMNKAGEMVANTDLQNSHPNTLRYIDKYADHVAGHSLSALGAVLNGGIDTVFKIAGVGPGVPKKMMEGIRTLMTAHMMGTYNPAFLATQLSQYWTGGLPEAAAIREAMGLGADDMVGAWHKMTWQTAAIAIENKLGKTMATIDPHMRDAFNWGAEHGITHFTEAQLSHNAQQSTGMRVAKGLANAPTILGEAATRPAIFMWYADLFHRAGMEGDQLHTTAKEATDYAMVNYHPDERPMIYSQLGYMGQFIGTLSTFKHNLLEQWTSRTLNGVKQPAAMAMMLGTGFLFYGLSGLPGFQEADNLFQNITGMTVREFAGQNLQPNNLWDGVVSTVTGLDFQNRMSMANVIPDSPGAGLAGAYLSNFADILMKAGKYAWDQDVASRNDAIRAVTPLGLRGIAEAKLYKGDEYTDDNGVHRAHVRKSNGQNKYEEGRTTKEWHDREVTGIRPIRERLEDEDVYADRKSVAKQNDKQHEQYNRMIAASNLNDEAGFTAAYDKWLKEGGDPKDITNQAIKDMIVNGKLSERQRRGGIGPKNSIKSIDKYEAYHDSD